MSEQRLTEAHAAQEAAVEAVAKLAEVLYRGLPAGVALRRRMPLDAMIESLEALEVESEMAEVSR